MHTFKTLCTLKLGTGLKTGDDFIEALRKANCRIDCNCNGMIRSPSFRVADNETEVELVEVSKADLGVEKDADMGVVYTRANEIGLDVCPAEVGPQLPLQHEERLQGKSFIIAMEPWDEQDTSLIFYVVWDKRGWHNIDYATCYSDCMHDVNARWVFMHRKKFLRLG